MTTPSRRRVKKSSRGGGWLAKRTKSVEFQRAYHREDVIEDFIAAIETEMARLGITRSELARMMNCTPENITQLMRRTNNLTIETMCNMAFALGCRVQIAVVHRSPVDL